jgi:predicted CDP-diglyceride synthetase/phosphatidate cytidylyltransferase
MSKVWDWANGEEGSCWVINLLMLSGAGMTVILGSIIIVLSIRELLCLHASRCNKITTIAVFVVEIPLVFWRQCVCE